ncbi:hypothetical protein CHLRE_02g086700v5 [Chlamydomonas reinhardtii]|uniref:Conserved oligomeric Golgi complex subunit 7 n=1 Tax=Chlamydomonas reinhardtii TaxID=3055 RepID=A0A2K3E0Z0_CHLRE|nr:uncharacterized protein CHLRE_02g086700v5 [Chlamydomonas reinhardtii]PNW86446.1 hypothetical protein CHLRE_02g086700v5 [Chlamydomonas reinhardtii]
MADILNEAFGEDGFDPISWINNACNNKATDEPLEKFLAELEMRLQLNAEDIEATLSDNSAQAMRRIPFAIQEIYRLQGDIQGMQDQVQVLAGSVQRDATDARGSVEHISQLHLVKANMENACNSLKEATELSGLFVKVEEVFAAGDLPKVAEILASMRRSLSLVGDVPEFRAGRQKLRALEDRLQTQVEGSLGEALARGADDEAMRKLCGLLLAVDRYGTIESLYVSTKMAKVHALWEEVAAAGAAAPEGAASWLATFLSRLLALLEAEARWAAAVLPGQAAALLGALCLSVFTKISKAARDRLAPVTHIAPLAGFAREVGGFGRALHELLRDVETGRRREVIALVYAPLEDKVAAYGELEAAQLAADLRAALPPAAAAAAAAAGDEAEGAVSRLATSIRPAFAALHAAVERCNALTGGSEVRALLKAVDGELAAYLAALQSAVSGLGAKHKARAAAGAAGGASAAEDGEDIANVLQLIKVGRELSAAVGRLEAALRTAVAAAVSRLQALVSGAAPAAAAAAAAAASGTPFASSSAPSGGAAGLSGAAEADPVALRLVAGRGERLAKLMKLGSGLSDPRFMVLPGSVGALDSFSATVQSTVFDVLLARVASLLASLPVLPEWRKGAEGSAHPAAPLPSFNTYPLPYVTAIGDHLMAMPQQLEVLMGDTGDDTSATAAAGGADASGGGAAEWEELAAEWLDKAVSGAAAMYADAIFKIGDLGQQGGCQLATDVEYFVNVMGALHVAPPPSLLTVQLLAGAAPEEFAELGRGALAEGAADGPALRALAGMRRIALEPVAAAPAQS